MNYAEAKTMQGAFAAIGGFTKVEIDHHGFYAAMTPEIEADGKWRIYLWAVNAAAGNHNCEMVAAYTSDPKIIARIARSAKGKATKRDAAAYAAAAADKANV